MNNLKVLSLDSREVAKMLPKAHAHLLRDIDKWNEYFTESNFGFSEFWQKSSYRDTTGRALKCYLITKKGCEFIAHKMTGKKGALFTATYINRFHEMEQALKERQTVAPAPVLKRVTYAGKIMMTAVDLSALSGIHNATLQRKAQKHKLPYILLTGKDMKTFKDENHLRTGASRIVLYPRDTVVSLLMLWNLYSKCKNVILDYFQVSSASIDSQWFVAETATINAAISSARKRLATLDGVLDQFTQSRRSFQEHISLLEFANELSTFTLRDLYKLKEQVALLKP